MDLSGGRIHHSFVPPDLSIPVQIKPLRAVMFERRRLESTRRLTLVFLLAIAPQVQSAFLQDQLSLLVPTQPYLPQRPLCQRKTCPCPIRLCAISPPSRNRKVIPDSQVSEEEDSDKLSYFLYQTARPFALFLLHSLLLAVVLLSWEDYICTNTLPSRHRTSLPAPAAWGHSTVRGMGFGKAERQLLTVADDLATRPSYNEIMQAHRQERVPRWTTTTTSAAPDIADATHTLLECYRAVKRLQGQAQRYEWDRIRESLASSDLLTTQLEIAASTLRSTIDSQARQFGNTAGGRMDDSVVVGFDWASCAYRHCGALADAQEALDELDYLLGVLEPYEAVFCLDIVERSLRDILVAVPWDQVRPQDTAAWKSLPAYEPKIYEPEVPGQEEEDRTSRVDEEYFAALQEFRVD